MQTLILNRRMLLNTVIITGVCLLLLFAWIYCGAVRRALVELGNTTKTAGGYVEAAAQTSNQALTAPMKNNNVSQPAAESSSTSKMPATAVTSQAKQDSKQFFAQFRLERDRVRSQQIDLLREMVNTPSTSAEAVSEAQKRMLELTRQMEKEMELENLMVAKGYPEAAAFIQSDSLTVVLLSGPLSEEQKKSVSGLASNLLGFAEEQVTIICRK